MQLALPRAGKLCLAMLAMHLAAPHVHAQQNGPEVGLASYYHDFFHGRMSASGAVFDNTLYTAAHRNLPFGTVVRVSNLANGKSTLVRITDRGPYNYTRCIDLSKAAAQEIGMLGPGVARVRVEVIGVGSVLANTNPSPNKVPGKLASNPAKPTEEAPEVEFAPAKLPPGSYLPDGSPVQPSSLGPYAVQLGARRTIKEAQEICRMLESEGYEKLYLTVTLDSQGSAWYRVLFGTFSSPEMATSVRNKLQPLVSDCFVTVHP